MALNFISFINQNTPNLSSAQKVKMLDDLCEAFGYDSLDTSMTKSEFANQVIQGMIIDAVHRLRKGKAEKVVTYETLQLP